MKLTRKQHKRLPKLLKKHSIQEVAVMYHVSEDDIKQYIDTTSSEINTYINVQTSTPHTDNTVNLILRLCSSSWTIVFILVILVFSVYATSLNNDFISDDIGTIVENRNIKNIEGITVAFPFVMRFALFYVIANSTGIDPFWFRFSNIFFHAGVCILIYLIGLKTTEKKSVAFIAALLYAVHPIFVESVAWIVGGIYVQYSFFVLLSLYFFILYVKKHKIWLLIITYLAAGMAFTTDIKSFVLPVLLIWYLLSFKLVKKQWKSAIIFIGIIIGAGIFGFPFLQSRLVDYQNFLFDNQLFVNPLQIPAAIFGYIQLMIVPVGLTFYHTGWNLSGLNGLFYIFVLCFFFWALWYGWKNNRIIFFWLGFFLISLSPMLLPVNVYAWGAERYVYLGGIGIIMLLSIGMYKLAQYTGDNKYIVLALSTLSVIIIFSFLTSQRTADWKNETTFAAAAARESPGTVLTMNNLGLQHAKNGEYEEALIEFDKVLALNPNFADAYLNKATVYRNMGNNEQALLNLQKSVELFPGCWQCHFNLGVLYFENQNIDLAVSSFETATVINTTDPQLLNNLATVYLQIGALDKAKTTLEKSLKLAPDDEKVKELFESL